VSSCKLLKDALGLDASYQRLQAAAAQAIPQGPRLSDSDRAHVLGTIAEVERYLAAMREVFDHVGPPAPGVAGKPGHCAD